MTGPKRVTEKQLAANRANALASTGPRTPAGIARSRWNALKHGALSKAVIPAALELFESRADFEELFETLRAELAPGTALEEMLVERIVTSYWRLARLLRAEAAVIAGRKLSVGEERAHAALVEDPRAPPTVQETLTRRMWLLSDALGAKRRLRQVMFAEDPRWRGAGDEELKTAAQTLLADLQHQLAEEEARVAEEGARAEAQARLQARDLRSIPPLDQALQFARYETTLERQIYRALEALERLQRLRAGEAVPAPLHLSVDLDVSGGANPGDQVIDGNG